MRHPFPLRGMGKGVERVVGTEKGRERESKGVEVSMSMWGGRMEREREGKEQEDRARATLIC